MSELPFRIRFAKSLRDVMIVEQWGGYYRPASGKRTPCGVYRTASHELFRKPDGTLGSVMVPDRIVVRGHCAAAVWL